MQPNEKDKKNSPEIRSKKRPLDISVKVWKELIKAYDKAYSLRKSGKERTKVFEFAHKIISYSLNNFSILPVHNEIKLIYVSGQGLEGRACQTSCHTSQWKKRFASLDMHICKYINKWNGFFFYKKVNDWILISITSPCAMF